MTQQERMGKISTDSLADRAREAIRKAIFEGTIRPDEKLSIERIAAELGISRTPVREALKSLESDGIISILPNKGLVVRRFDSDEFSQRYALRALLEGYAGEAACQRHGAALVPALEANVTAMEEKIRSLVPGSDDLDCIRELVELNLAFHDIILRASGCSLVVKVLDSLQMPVAYRLYQWRVPHRPKAIVDHHREIIEAFRDNDAPRARAALEGHIQDVRDFLLATAEARPA